MKGDDHFEKPKPRGKPNFPDSLLPATQIKHLKFSAGNNLTWGT